MVRMDHAEYDLMRIYMLTFDSLFQIMADYEG